MKKIEFPTHVWYRRVRNDLIYKTVMLLYPNGERYKNKK